MATLVSILGSNPTLSAQAEQGNQVFDHYREMDHGWEEGSPTVYLLLVELNGLILVYVGFTRRSFAVRLREHAADKTILGSLDFSSFLLFDDQLPSLRQAEAPTDVFLSGLGARRYEGAIIRFLQRALPAQPRRLLNSDLVNSMVDLFFTEDVLSVEDSIELANLMSSSAPVSSSVSLSHLR